METLLKTAEAARVMGVQPQTLRLWRTHGKGPKYIRYGGPRGRAMYRQADIEEFFAGHTCNPEGEV